MGNGMENGDGSDFPLSGSGKWEIGTVPISQSVT